MKRVIIFIALGIYLSSYISELHAMECKIVDADGRAIYSANAGELVYFQSTYTYNKSKKLTWNLMVSLPSIDMKKYKTSIKQNGYFYHERSLNNEVRLISIVIPKDYFVEGTTTFKYTLTGNGNCDVSLNILQDSEPDKPGAHRLKIFVTSKGHIGDFANDPYLTGTTGIAKADNFCKKDTNKPSDANYKALLVDGINRDAVNSLDWVLQPNTTYYRSDNITEIGTTTATAIFPTAYADLTNTIDDVSGYNNNPDDYYETFAVWTGLANSTNFTADYSNCHNWSNGTNQYSSTAGKFSEKGALAFSGGGSTFGCTFKFKLYCVEQP
jgi:hypothetical protein